MKNSVKKQGLNCVLFSKPDNFENGSLLPDRMPWVLNCALCAEVCMEAFNKFPGKHIFYLDADAVMERFPSLLFDSSLTGFDVAAPILTNKYVKDELVSNAIIFRRTRAAELVLKNWVTETQRRLKKLRNGEYQKPYKEAWDQYILRDVIKTTRCRFLPLPWEYAKITPTERGEELMEGIDPEKIVISQYQCSRWNKFKVGRTN